MTTNQLETIDKGHTYLLPSYDGGAPQHLTFMKREGTNFPGNVGHYPGTNLQSVLRACLARTQYLNGQIGCPENMALMCHLRHAILGLEQRAAVRHGMNPKAISIDQACFGPTCEKCGHVVCHGHQ